MIADVDLLRVALVDDTPEIRQAVRLSLEHDGRFVVVGEAGDGQEGVALAAREQPHAVLLDLAMPVMDGLQAIPHIREVSPQTRIVILSGFAEERMGHEALQRGADRYLTKGVAMTALADELLAVCGWPSRPATSTAAPLEPTVALGLVPTDLTTLLHEELRLLVPAAGGRLVELTAPPAVQVCCDPGRIRQVVAALVSSTVDHAAPDTPVEITLSVEGDHAELAVLGFGRRMLPDRTARLLEDPAVGGELGLSVARTLARAHGGDLRLDLPPDGGCRFVLTLPV